MSNNSNLYRASIWIDKFSCIPDFSKDITDPESFVSRNKLEPWNPPIEYPDSFNPIDPKDGWYQGTIFKDGLHRGIIVRINQYLNSDLDGSIIDELFNSIEQSNRENKQSTVDSAGYFQDK